MQTASHCVIFANNESVAFEGNPYNAGIYSGFIATLVGNPNSQTSTDVLLDATLIGVPATPSIAGEMFVGSNTAATKYDIPSIGSIPFDTALCANGSATGTHCNLERTGAGGTRLQICSQPATCRWFDVIPVESIDGSLIFGQGDSGGAIYRLSDKRVVGLITAGVGLYPCGSLNWYYDPPSLLPQCTKLLGYVTSMAAIATELTEQNPDLEPRLRP